MPLTQTQAQTGGGSQQDQRIYDRQNGTNTQAQGAYDPLGTMYQKYLANQGKPLVGVGPTPPMTPMGGGGSPQFIDDFRQRIGEPTAQEQGTNTTGVNGNQGPAPGGFTPSQSSQLNAAQKGWFGGQGLDNRYLAGGSQPVPGAPAAGAPRPTGTAAMMASSLRTQPLASSFNAPQAAGEPFRPPTPPPAPPAPPPGPPGEAPADSRAPMGDTPPPVPPPVPPPGDPNAYKTGGSTTAGTTGSTTQSGVKSYATPRDEYVNGAEPPKQTPYTTVPLPKYQNWTTSGQPISITTFPISVAELSMIRRDLDGSKGVTELLDRAQSAALGLQEANQTTDYGRRQKLMDQWIQQYGDTQALLKRYGIDFDPFKATGGNPPPLPGAGTGPTDFQTNLPSGVAADRTFFSMFNDKSLDGLEPEQKAAIIQTQMGVWEKEMSLDRMKRGSNFMMGEYENFKNDPNRLQAQAMVDEWGRNPDPLSAKDNAAMRGQLAAQYDNAYEQGQGQLARMSASGNMAPGATSGTAVNLRMANRQDLSNQLAQQEIARALRVREGQSQAVSGWRQGSQLAGADQGIAGNIASLIAGQPQPGQNPMTGLTDFVTGAEAAKWWRDEGADLAKDQANAGKWGGIMSGLGGLMGGFGSLGSFFGKKQTPTA